MAAGSHLTTSTLIVGSQSPGRQVIRPPPPFPGIGGGGGSGYLFSITDHLCTRNQ